MSGKKAGKEHVVRAADQNCTEGNVKTGTRRTEPIPKTTIWARSLKKLQIQP
jgi:hypothetical protein